MGQADLTLNRDRHTHQANLAALEAQREAERQAIASVSELLGASVTLRGRKTLLQNGSAEDVDEEIERIGDGNTF